MSTATPAGVFPALHAEFLRARGTAPDPVQALRASALARLEERGLPGARDEEWRQTSITPITSASFRLPEEARVDPGVIAPLRFDAHEAVFVNGRFSPGLSSLATLPAGVQIASLRERLSSEAVRAHLAQVASVDGRPFTALNMAFLDDGALVELPAGCVLEKPVHLVFFSTSRSGPPSMSSPRVLILARPNSQARVVETYAGPTGESYFTNAVTEIAVEDGAVVEHYKRQQEGERAFHIGRIEARLGRASRLDSFSFAFGAQLARTDIEVRFAGEGGECGMYGLFLGHRTQHLDHHTLIDHAAPHCSSREVYKGVLDGKSRGVFFGTIIVRPGAQKTDAQQTNKNLLLSPDALVNSTPRLQIEADDVRCKHGSTTGQIDPAALFYLRSRGIGEEQARSLMTYAFAADVIERIRVAPLKQALAAYLDTRLPGAGDIAEAAHV